jgi:enoyl-CoA hydratase/carnithine racemase
MTTVSYDKRDRIAYVTIDRPAARNAIDLETHEALCAAWADFRDDDAVDVAILTGAGDEAFCAGADLKTYIPPIIRGERDIRAIVELGLGGLTRGMHRIRKPVIAAVNGWALPAASSWPSRATFASPPSARASGPSRPAGATTTATGASSGSSTRAAWASRATCC